MKFTGLEIAVIGMAARFPGAKNVAEFWDNLKNGLEAISFFSDEEVGASGADPALLKAPNYIKAHGCLEGIEYFDSSFFGYTPAEVDIMDPQMRVFHECAWTALEDAGYCPSRYHGLIGIYAGATHNLDWIANLQFSGKAAEYGQFAALQLAEKDFLSMRVSYKLNLRGPAIILQTACSTSLVAIHTACQAILNGECDMALAGGVTVSTLKKEGYIYHEGLILSPDGHCRAFDARSRGTVSGNGAAVVVLKRLESAATDRDHIYAAVKSSAINNDGIRKAGFSAPSIEGQAEAIMTAQEMAEVDPETITYVETHGTGTELGDPVEIEALNLAFGTNKRGYCAVGSVKTNVGHLDSAAGVAGFIKTVLALYHRLLPPSLHFESSNLKIDFENSPFYVNTRLKEWKNDSCPLRAGVSSFGIGGTNAHVILEEWPGSRSSVSPRMDHGARGEGRQYQLILLSAKTETALKKMTKNLLNYFKRHLDDAADPFLLANTAYTLQVGREAFKYRQMLVCPTSGMNETITILSARGAAEVHSWMIRDENHPPQLVFMFPGQGAQYVDMGLELYRAESVFRQEMDRCFKILEPLMGCDLKEILYPPPSTHESSVGAQRAVPPEKAADHRQQVIDIDQTEIAQPLIFIIEYALAKLLMKWGLKPDAMIGHSIGEYTAACLSGVFSLEDALKIVALRGNLMQKMPGGAMLSIASPEAQLKSMLDQNSQLSLAAVNSPSNCTVSGPRSAIDDFEKQLKEKGYECRQLHTSHAFHSPMMEPILRRFEDEVSRISLNEPEISYVSNLTGTWITAGEATDPGYWTKHLRHTVRFSDGVQGLLEKQPVIFMEIGPGRTLTTFVKHHTGEDSGQMVLNLFRHPNEAVSDVYYLLKRIGQVWLYGKTIDWQAFYAGEKRQRIPLPTYPFEGLRYQLELEDAVIIKTGKGKKKSPIPQKEEKLELAHWFYSPVWRPSPIPGEPDKNLAASLESGSNWLVFVNGNLDSRLIERLELAHQDITLVQIGPGFTRLKDGKYAVSPQQHSDYQALLDELRSINKMPRRIVHLWNVTGNPLSRDEALGKGLDDALVLGFYSLLSLAQAIGSQGLTDRRPGSGEDKDNDKDKIEIIVFSNRMQSIRGDEILEPQKAVIRGVVQVIPREYPQISCRSIDIDSVTAGEGEGVDNLLAEMLNHVPETYVAYRDSQRWVQTFEKTSLEETDEEIPLLREKGVYLITGGLGGIGLTLAEYLAKNFKARLILVGRSPFPIPGEWDEWLLTHDESDDTSSKIRKVQEFEAAGAEVMILQVDVATLEQMQTAAAHAEDYFGKINGIIHAAGLPDGGLVQRRSRQMSETVFAPKIRGTLVLDAIFANKERSQALDFVVLCSSISSVLAPVGQVAYCAANAFLNAFAGQKTAAGNSFPYIVSVNWDAWQEVGMAVKAGLLPSPRQKLKVQHPLFSRRDVYGPGHEEFISRLSKTRHWVLDEHRIMGVATLPGTAYLEMARAAVANLGRGESIELRDVYFLSPLTVEEDEEKEARTILKKMGDNGGYNFSIVSRSAAGEEQWVEHSRGKILLLEEKDIERKQYRIEEIGTRCSGQEKNYFQGGKSFDFGSMTFGPRWDNLRTAALLAKDQAFGCLELFEAFSVDIDSYKLHPAMLDMATILLGRVREDEGNHMPFYYKKISIKGPLPGKIFCLVRSAGNDSPQQETFAYDVTILDEQGVELVDIEEYTLKKVKTEQHLNVSLGISSPGSFDHLEFRPLPRRRPGAGEVEIAVYATGLNFKEVLLALGALGTLAPDFAFGFECAGKITACGEGVTGFNVGDEVIAFGSSCFSSYITTPVSLVALKPANLSFQEAATIPVAFMTAYYALITLGKLSRGERVLIHSAAGGVGMAAVQIAQWKGAEIFASAGNEEKRSYLHSLGIEHVMDSRTLDFADEVMKRTDGKGVNVVLNSLSGEFISRSISLLAPYGRFLEIGIRDMLNDMPLGLRPFLKGLSYFSVSLAPDLPGIESVWQEVVQHFHDGTFTPLPLRTFPLGEVAQAFEYMSGGKHIGKIVVIRPDRLGMQSQELPGTLQREALKHGILPWEGVEVFKRILGNEKSPQVVVSTTDFFNRVRKARVLTGVLLLEELNKSGASGTRQARPQLSTEFVVPTNETEKILAHIWQEFLGIQEVGILDDFFELGGDSLKVMTITSKIHKALDIEISINEFFNRPTIKKLAEYIKVTGEHTYSCIEPVELKEYYPLSSAQQRLYILQQIEKDFIGYNETLAFVVEGRLDRERFEEAFIKLIKRHESLRTSFEMIREESVQKINQEIEFKIENQTLLSQEENESLASRSKSLASIITNFVRPFELSHAPLLRVGLIEVNKDKHILIYDMHHIISDGSSVRLVAKEFLSLYRKYELPPLKIQYKDFSEWQNNLLKDNRIMSQEEFWLNEFSDEVPVLNLPTDYPRPLMQSFEGRSIFFEAASEDTRALKKLALRENATLYMVLLAIYSVLLSKISGQEDIVIGVPIAGRRHADVEQVIGMFVNTLAVRSYPAGERTFRDFFLETKTRILDAFENQEYQIEDVVEKLTVNLNRDTSRNPLFDVVFVFQNLAVRFDDAPVTEGTGLNMMVYEFENKPSKFDLVLNGKEVDERLYFEIEYCTRLFRKETIEWWIQYFTRLMSLVTAEPGIKISDIEIVSEAEKHQMLYIFNDTKAEYPRNKTIHELFEERAARTPNRTALVVREQASAGRQSLHLTYDELNEKSHRLAHSLRQRGVKADTIVGIMVEPSVQMILGIWGILKAGGAYLPIDPDYPAERIRFMLADSGINILLTNCHGFEDAGNLGKKEGRQASNGQVETLFIEQSAECISQHSLDLPPGPATSLAYVIYTSGTTGKPKGVMIEHGNVVRLMVNDQFLFDFNQADVWTLFHSFCFDFSVWEMYGALLYGGQLLVIPRMLARDSMRYLELLKEIQVTVLNHTPSAFFHLMNLEIKNPKKELNIRYVIFGGEALAPARVREWKQRYPQTRLINMYGITETTVHVTFKEVEDREIEANISSIGKPIPTLSTYIMDKNLKLVPIGTAGELTVGGEGPGRGYLNRAELTSEKFVENPYKGGERLYRSGDLARMSHGGELKYLGRADTQVKIRGFRVELGEIENRLLSHDDIDEAVLILKEDGGGDKYLCAYFVSNHVILISELREYLSRDLPGYMIPAYFMHIDKIPLTPNGKLNRKALPDPEIKIGVEYAAPRDEMEMKLVEIWFEVLGRDALSVSRYLERSGSECVGRHSRLGIDDDFFELGGHSLRATILAARIHKEFNIKVPLGEIFKTPTIRGLSDYLKGAKEDKYTSISPAEKREYFTLSSAQERLYMLQQMEIKSTAYNMPFVVILEGEVNREKLEQVFYQLICRHESLRTSFIVLERAGAVIQKIHDEEGIDFKPEYYDLSTETPLVGSPGAWARVDDLVKNFIRPFDLVKAPLMRVGLIKLTGNRYILMLDTHHIISDGTSQSLFAEEFMALYAAEGLPELRIHYKDYSEWQKKQRENDGDSLKIQEEYWLKELKVRLPVLNLPTDFMRPAVQSFAGDILTFKITGEDSIRLRKLAFEERASLFVLLLVIYKVFVSKISRQDDILIGTQVAGRRHSDLQDIIGVFLNTLVLRSFPQGEKTFKDFLKESREKILKAFENQDYQFEDLIEKLSGKREINRNPLFDVMFVWQNFDINEIHIPGLTLKPYETRLRDKALLDLSLYGFEQGEDLLFYFEYATSLFKKKTIERFVIYFKEIASAVIDDKEIKLRDIKISHDLGRARPGMYQESDAGFEF